LTGGAGAVEEAEVAVVGAGPAGSTAAATLAELGHEVLLIDKAEFPREKPCGDSVMQPAITIAERLGLGALIESSMAIESGRLVLGHRRQTSTRFRRGAGRPLPRCIRRGEFDAGLLGAARERGARLLHARVDGLDAIAGGQRLLLAGEGGPATVRAGVVIAADGATSRIRRIANGGSTQPTAYAIRRYFRAERQLEPVLHLDLPLEIDGRILPGYGWVFPIEEHVANIGVGIVRQPYVDSPSLRRLLDIYVAELEARAARRFGDLEPSGEPLGSPVGIRPRIEVSELPEVALLGDAAGMTHPLTGEGISFAMRGGEFAAAALPPRLRRWARRSAAAAVGIQIRRSFPQLGVDTAPLTRISMLEVNRAPSGDEMLGSMSGPFLETVKRFARESAYDTGVAGSVAWAALASSDAALGSSLERANDLLLDRLADGMPFVREMIHASIQSHLGPMYAAAVMASASVGGRSLPASALEAGVAVESVGVMPRLLTLLVDRAGSKQLQVNNALGVLTVDYAATRALTAATTIGSDSAVTAVGRACQSGCQGGMRDAASRYAADRTIASWYAAARETAGTAMILATQFGAIVRGDDVAAAEGLRQYSLELGVAIRLAEEIVDLTVDEGPLPEGSGAVLKRGIYPLPVLYALEAEPSLARLLAQHTAGQCGAAEIVDVVRASGALDRARSRCLEHVEAARSLARAEVGGDGGAVSGLAAAPAEYVAARAAAAVPEAC
jgi:menaquinone-9 beta-reductase